MNELPPKRPTHLPRKPGVYLMRDASGAVLYIGKASDLAKRVAQYFDAGRLDDKTRNLMPLVREIDYIAAASERDALLVEQRLIRRHKPFFNVMWRDDKSYPFVKLTLGEDFPRMFLTRRKADDGARYYGPYPKVWAARSLLRYLWRSRIAALRPCDFDFNLKKPLGPKKIQACLYYHTKECPAPCAGRVTRTEYRRVSRRAALFFEGRFDSLRREVERAMKRASASLDYEQAARFRDNLAALEHIGERVALHEVREEELEARVRAGREVSELQSALGLAKPPAHIEAFDVSHLFGRQSVGSMTCFVDGLPNKSHYRRFRIRSVGGIDDFKSMNEIVGRRYGRLKETGERMPDLVLIDGGKGQLGAAGAALEELKLRLPLAALAKREEELFVPGRAEPVLLPRESPALHLVQRLRDEAHRFGVTFHRRRRGKALFGEDT